MELSKGLPRYLRPRQRWLAPDIIRRAVLPHCSRAAEGPVGEDDLGVELGEEDVIGDGVEQRLEHTVVLAYPGCFRRGLRRHGVCDLGDELVDRGVQALRLVGAY